MIGEEPRPSDPTLQEDWDERSSAGYYLMSQSLELNQRHHVMHLLPEVECGPKAWTVLKELHAPTSVVATLMLERELSALRLSEGEPVQPVLDKMRDLYAKLATAGESLTEQDQVLEDALAAARIVASIYERIEPAAEPELVDARVGADEDSGGGLPSPPTEGWGRRAEAATECKGTDVAEDVASVVLGAVQRRTTTPTTNKEGYGWGRGAKSGRGGANRNRHQDGGARGTEAPEKTAPTWSLIRPTTTRRATAVRRRKKKKERTAGQFFHVGDKGEQGDASAKVGAELHPIDYWVLDTGAAWTMTPRKDLLDEVRAAPINEVCSASGHMLKVAGAGRAAFKGADGKPVVLHDVLFVPDLKANLISLRKLGKAGVNTNTDGARTYKGKLGNRVLWDLHESKDVGSAMPLEGLV
ncbi:unnamed protein product [Closterium sp. Yama58-4]|nr:unnamed protein product [Closterium sp. Yama58-4]